MADWATLEIKILNSERGEYGKEVIKTLSKKLTTFYGRGWSERHLWHCLRFAETFPSIEKVSALRRQLSWTNIKALIYIEDPLKRDFYLQICQMESWTSRELQDQISSMLYERTALSRQPAELIEEELAFMSATGNPTTSVLSKCHDSFSVNF